jgi:predicted RNA-binding protein with RPS1 domain
MVDNYDASNDLFILSYKKYIQKSMPYMVSELNFGRKYTGILTNRPYDFGVFVEFEGYYTGLIHSSEFENYDKIKSTLKAGDEIDFYIKNVTKKGSQYRIVLTLDPDTIDSEKKRWDQLRSRTEGQSFEYDVDSSNNSISIYIDGESFNVTMRRLDLERNLNNYPMVKVSKVDPINKNLKFECVESN